MENFSKLENCSLIIEDKYLTLLIENIINPEIAIQPRENLIKAAGILAKSG